MATWVAAIVDTAGKTDLWHRLAAHRIFGTEAPTPIPERLLIDCDAYFSGSLPNFAETLSRELGTEVIAFGLQTVVDWLELRVYRNGEQVRSIHYCPEDEQHNDHLPDGWLCDEGASQEWEQQFFFDNEDDVSLT